MLIVKLLLTALAYGVAAVALFGDPLQPIALATFWSDRLGVPNWRSSAILGGIVSALVFALPLRNTIIPVLRPPLFVMFAVLVPTVMVGVYADRIRHHAVLAFGADEVVEHSFFASIRKAPADLQFFLHTAALKGCTPYAWSYRKLEFYALPPNVGVNVLPHQWIERCKIERR